MVHLFRDKYGLEQVKSPDNADIIIWNGGEDIGTEIYNEKPVMRGIPLLKSYRDQEEIDMFDKFKAQDGKLLLGVCRGSQLLNCLNGGSLYQDVDGHTASHPMIDLKTGEVLSVTSTHHQQMRPNPNEGEIIGVAAMSTYKHSASGVDYHKPTDELRLGVDVEIMWYPKTHTLCVQGHPEYVPSSRFASYVHNLLVEAWNACTGQKTILAA
jgi:carbamoylphosphate synthase small subunit